MFVWQAYQEIVSSLPLYTKRIVSKGCWLVHHQIYTTKGIIITGRCVQVHSFSLDSLNFGLDPSLRLNMAKLQGKILFAEHISS